MKFRKGFVSNSSSSSFVCDLCGSSESGWDMSLSEAGMFECENGHLLCNEHKLKVKEDERELTRDEKIAELIEYQSFDKKEQEDLLEDSDEVIEQLYEDMLCDKENDADRCTNAKYCPICQLEELDDNTLVLFLLKEKGTTKKKFVKDLKEKYGTLQEAERVLNKKDK